MSRQLRLFEERILTNPEHMIRTGKWEEHHKNGKLWIDGEFIIVKDEHKEFYKFLSVNGEAFVRIGVWSKHFDNGQLAWQLDYGDGRWESNIRREELKSWRKDGTPIIM